MSYMPHALNTVLVAPTVRSLGSGLVVITAWLIAQEALAQGCAMCQTLFPNANERVAYGMLQSAFFLMTMPFIVFGSIGGWIAYRYWKTRRAARTDLTEQSQPSIPAAPVSKEEQP